LHQESIEAGSTVSAYDLNGKLFYSGVVNRDKLEIDINDWLKGIYILQIKGTDRIFHAKLIKE
jgi:hypothetical protein